ncbi:DUF1178 family protein [Aureimonas pseudogalii]|uniref:DUF1178 family protein n=1 Tax=Aureimonas pseudogalii TaxID=1744844 RepID=A0A7W6E7M3_9HYPH|nr:DUF1178 family protein [Aureimonas pseudogalii]MBB3996232.1 hypothetical protein [Aureimonas pseudogalii]
MIRYALRCEPEGHAFDGWFRSGADFDAQAARGLLECPACGSSTVAKALMRPAVGASAVAPASTEAVARPPAEMVALYRQMQEMAREVRAKADYVGPNFAEEARRIHYGESEERRIYGEATAPQVKGLLEEGIAALPLPALPEDKN